MIRINCPFCGERDHSEFSYGGDASIEYPELNDSIEKWVKAIFFRKNIYGIQEETWQHIHGCRLWIKVTRSTITHEITSVEPAHKGIKQFLEDNK